MGEAVFLFFLPPLFFFKGWVFGLCWGGLLSGVGGLGAAFWVDLWSRPFPVSGLSVGRGRGLPFCGGAGAVGVWVVVGGLPVWGVAAGVPIFLCYSASDRHHFSGKGLWVFGAFNRVQVDQTLVDISVSLG